MLASVGIGLIVDLDNFDLGPMKVMTTGLDTFGFAPMKVLTVGLVGLTLTGCLGGTSGFAGLVSTLNGSTSTMNHNSKMLPIHHDLSQNTFSLPQQKLQKTVLHESP